MNGNRWAKSVFGASGLAVLIAVAANGNNLVAVATSAFRFLLLLAKDAPLGLKSYAIATALAVLVQAFVNRYAAQLPCPRSRELALSSLALGIGFAVMYAQLRTLNGALLGLMCGFSAPFVYQLVAAGWSWITKPTPEDDTP